MSTMAPRTFAPWCDDSSARTLVAIRVRRTCRSPARRPVRSRRPSSDARVSASAGSASSRTRTPPRPHRHREHPHQLEVRRRLGLHRLADVTEHDHAPGPVDGPLPGQPEWLPAGPAGAGRVARTAIARPPTTPSACGCAVPARRPRSSPATRRAVRTPARRAARTACPPAPRRHSATVPEQPGRPNPLRSRPPQAASSRAARRGRRPRGKRAGSGANLSSERRRSPR